MKKLFLALFVSGTLSSLEVQAAEPCGKHAISYYDKTIELVNVINKPEKDANGAAIRGNAKVAVAGIYMFVRNGQMWNVYRCADTVKRDEANVPLLNLNNCVLKNDFQYGSLVKRFGSSGVKVEGDGTSRLLIRLNASGDPNYYEVQSTADGLEVSQQVYKENKEKRWESRHWKTSLGVCRHDGSNSTGSSGGQGDRQGSQQGTRAKKVSGAN